jgi:hypothetical protein
MLHHTLVRVVIRDSLRVGLHYSEQLTPLLFLGSPFTNPENAFLALQTGKHLHVIFMNALALLPAGRLVDGKLRL